MEMVIDPSTGEMVPRKPTNRPGELAPGAEHGDTCARMANLPCHACDLEWQVWYDAGVKSYVFIHPDIIDASRRWRFEDWFLQREFGLRIANSPLPAFVRVIAKLTESEVHPDNRQWR